MLSVSERASKVVGDRGLSLGPSILYPVKAAATRTRSLVWLARPRGGSRPGLRILFYHRVSDDRDELAVTPRAFARQMAAIADAGYRATDVGEVVRLLREGRVDERVVGLSFDDAYRDVSEHGLGVLADLGFRATVFVATGVTDGRASFEWYERQPPLLSWAEIREQDGGVFSFEPHTVTHRNLLTLADDEAAREIAGSKAELEERLGRPTSLFCYPAGLFGERERRLVAEAGFEAAVSCEPGPNDASSDLYALRRIQIDARDALVDVRAKLGGAHDTPLPLRAAWRRARYGMASNRS